MSKEVLKIGYEDTDKKIEIDIYGIRFEINKKNIETEKEYKENGLDEILGAGAIEKINQKRIADGYDKMTLSVEVEIYSWIQAKYVEAVTNPLIDNIHSTVEKQKNKINNMFDERNYNVKQKRNNRYNKYNKNNFRRY